MHKINVLAFGSENFNTSLDELKEHLNFKLTIINDNFEQQLSNGYDVLFIHEDCLKNNNIKKKLLEQNNKIKILVSSSIKKNIDNFTDVLILPTKIEDINKIIEDTVSKKNFNINSSIICPFSSYRIS